MNHSQVAHAWAHKRSAKGCNMFTDGETIYSYGHHFAIAKHMENGAVLFNSASYSNSTAKHQCRVRSAMNGNGFNTFTVSEIPRHELDTEDNLHNLARYVHSIECNVDKASRARTYAAMYERDAQATFNEMLNYISTFKILQKNIPSRLRRFIKSIRAEGLFAGKQAELIRKRKKSQRLAEAKAIKDRAIARAQCTQEQEIKWRNHETSWFNAPMNKTVLRVSLDGKWLETSKGIKIGIRIAHLLYDRKQAGENLIGENVADSVNHDYTIEKWNGVFKSGCHIIDNDEIDTLAKSLNW